MRIRGVNYKTIVASLLAAVLLVSSFGIVLPQKAAAAGETYTWKDAAIEARGGLFRNPPITPQLNQFGSPNTDSSPLIFSATFVTGGESSSTTSTWSSRDRVVTYGPSGNPNFTCTFRFRITLNVIQADESRGTIEAISAQPDVCSQQVLDAYNSSLTNPVVIRGAPPEIAGTTSPEGSGIGTEEACTTSLASLGWLLCPMNNLFIEAATWIDERIMELLFINACRIFNNDGSLNDRCADPLTGHLSDNEKQSSEAMYNAWRIFRNIAYALLIILGLIMVVSQIMGLELFDAYTVRKMLPRIVVVGIVLPLLWPILRILTVMFNDAGTALMELIRGPFNYLGQVDAEFHNMLALGTGAAAVVIGAVAAAFLAFGVIASGAWSVLIVVVIGILIAVIQAVIVLTVRDMAYFLGVLVSSVALVTAVFEPFKASFAFWRRIMTGILLSIPAVAAVLTITKVLAALALLTHPNAGTLIAAIVVVAGYFMFWRTLKAVDKTTAAIDKAASSVTGGAQRWLSGYRNKRFMQQLGTVAARRGNTGGPLGGVVRATQSVIGGAADLRHVRGANPRRWRAQIQNAKPRSIMEALKAYEEDPDLTAFNNDDVLHAAAAELAAEGKAGDRRAVRAKVESMKYERDENGEIKKDENGNMVLSNRYRGMSEAQIQEQMKMDEEAILLAHSRLGAHAADVLKITLPSTGSNAGESIGEMMEYIYEAARGDLGVQATLWSAVKERAMKAGRTDFGIRQGGALQAIQAYANKLKEVTGQTVKNPDGTTRQITPDEAKEIARQHAREIAVDLAFDQQGASAIIQGRPEVATEAAEYVVRKRKKSVEKLGTAQSDLADVRSGKTVIKGKNADGSDHILTEDEALQALSAARNEYEHTIADTEALVDVVAYASPEKGRTLAGGLGYVIDLDQKEFEPLKIELESRFEERYPGALTAWDEWEVNARDAAADGNPPPPQPKVPRLPRKFTERDLARLTEQYGLMPDLANTIDERRRRYRDQLADPSAYERTARGGAPPTGIYSGFGG